MDRTGRPIRPDVRLAGHEIWEQACQRTHLLVADDGPAAELMEYTVAQVSRYLDRIGRAPVHPEARTSLGSLLSGSSPLRGQVESSRIGRRIR